MPAKKPEEMTREELLELIARSGIAKPQGHDIMTSESARSGGTHGTPSIISPDEGDAGERSRRLSWEGPAGEAQGIEEVGGPPEVLPGPGRSDDPTGRGVDEDGGVGESGLDDGDTDGDLRSRAGLTSQETSLPRDVILNDLSDIGATAGAASRFDANLAAIRTVKQLDDEGRQATPQEQALLAKYSGFGDSAFEQAFLLFSRDEPWKRRGDDLRSLLTDDDYRALERSRLNAFYTTPEIIKAMWEGLHQLGAGDIDHPRILEPSAGSGRFLGFQPADMAARSQRIAVELDPLTGKLLKHLYPNAEVHTMGYQEAPIADSSVDIAISNVPFGNIPIHDPSFSKGRRILTRSIHNYFFAKALKHLRPGGVLAFVTSHNTLDAPKARPVREMLAEQADMVAAVRLPKTTFPDTDVVTDIIFMRKRLPSEEQGDTSWIDTSPIDLEVETSSGYKYPTTANVNQYFLKHPEMVLGKHSAAGSMYGGGEYTVEPFTDRLLKDDLARSLETLPKGIVSGTPADLLRSTPVASPLNVPEGAHLIGEDGLVYVNQHGALAKADLSKDEEARVIDMLAIRDATRAVIDTQLGEKSPEVLSEARTHLNDLYDRFVAAHGTLMKNTGLLRNDPDQPLLRALERPEAEKVKGFLSKAQADAIKMPLFTERTIHGMPERDINSETDAVIVALNETGRLDFERMAELLGQDKNEVRDSLAEQGRIFKNPLGDWEMTDKYLTGDVREKLRIAERAAEANKAYLSNVEALKTVQPEDLPPSQISARLGAPWIPSEDVTDFTDHLLGTRNYQNNPPYFSYVAETGDWVKEGVPSASTAALRSDWGTSRMAATEILLRILNGKMVEVYDKVEDKPVRSPQETVAAQEKAKAIEAAFKEWIWSDPERAARLAKIYNNTFNNYRPRAYDGQHQELPGMARDWAEKIHPHQKDAIWRVVQDRTALLGHEVGFGKTAVMVGSAMELRRLGLVQKNLFVVPKSTHKQFYDQFLDIYPHANVLYPSDNDFTPANRAEFVSRAVTGDWDAVILSDSQYRRIPVRPETQIAFLREEVASLRAALEAEAGDSGTSYGRRRGKSVTHKEIQKALLRAETRLKETQAKVREVGDKTIFFEDMGVDQVFVDEADMFKNLRFVTRMGRLKGLPNTDSERAWDMYQKVRYLQDKGRNTGVVFATGTPIANTIAEMYTMMRYLQQPMLEKKGLQHFDAWAKTFGETTEALEQTPTGQYKLTQRFSKFANAPELSNIWQQVTDIRVADEVPSIVRLRPRIVDDEGRPRRTVVSTPPDDALLDYMKSLAKRADELKNMDPREDNMLKIASDARLASLDMRMVDPHAPVNPKGKIAVVSSKIADIYRDTTQDKGAQLVFLDVGTPKAPEGKDKDVENDEAGEVIEDVQVLRNVYGVIKEELVASGVPENEIAFIHDAKNDAQRRRLYQRVNAGDIRVIIGSTGKMGTGVNVQERAAALHHLDAPWRPRDIEQREGRIVRQGNLVYGPERDAGGQIVGPGKGVRIHTYVTERSFDAYMWQAIESKSKAIKSIMRRETPPREIEDIDSFTMSAGEAKAVASGNPDVLKAVTLKNQVLRLEMLKASHLDTRVRAKTQLLSLPEIIKDATGDVERIGQDATRVIGDVPFDFKGDAPFDFKIKGQRFTERPQAAEALRAAIIRTPQVDSPSDAPEIGSYKGFTVRILSQPGAGEYRILLENPTTKYQYATGVPITELTAAGAMQRLDNKIKSIPVLLQTKMAELERSRANLASYQKQAESPFEYADRLVAMQGELTRLEKKLQGEDVSDVPEASFEALQEEPLKGEGPTYRFTPREPEVAEKAVLEAPKSVSQETASGVQKEQEMRSRLSDLETKRFKTRGDEITMKRLARTLAAKPDKWKVGQGVGWRPVEGQVNRGYRIEQVIPETKEAIIRPVGDIGQIADYTGQAERVNIIDLLRDRKYDVRVHTTAPIRPEPAAKPAGETPTIKQALEDWRSGRAYIDNAGNYRIKAEGRPSGPIAPWNKEAKATFESVQDLHKAATAAPTPPAKPAVAKAVTPEAPLIRPSPAAKPVAQVGPPVKRRRRTTPPPAKSEKPTQEPAPPGATREPKPSKRDLAIQAKQVVPENPQTPAEMRLYKKWLAHPTQLDKEGVDTKRPTSPGVSPGKAPVKKGRVYQMPGQALPPGRYPRIIEWVQGKTIVRYNLGTNEWAFRPNLGSASRNPARTLKVIETSAERPKRRRKALGFEDVIVGPHKLEFIYVPERAEKLASPTVRRPSPVRRQSPYGKRLFQRRGL